MLSKELVDVDSLVYSIQVDGGNFTNFQLTNTKNIFIAYFVTLKRFEKYFHSSQMVWLLSVFNE